MNNAMRRVIDMAGRVRDFCRTHPQQNEGFAAAVDRLEERIVRAQALADQEVAGHLTVTGAVATRQELRQEIRDTVNFLAGLARAAGKEHPELKAGITRFPVQGSDQDLLTKARVAADTAQANREILVRFGLPDGVVESLAPTLEQFAAAINERNSGRAAHVGARADLRAVHEEIMMLVGLLDAINRFQLRTDPELLAAWKSARNVAWPGSASRDTPGAEPEKPAA